MVQFTRTASFHPLSTWHAARSVLGAVVLAVVAAPAVFGQITIATVTIGNPGNAVDSTGFGAVAYIYNIGSTEVTNAQYAAFLNAVAATDTNNLYNVNMAGFIGGITRSGSPGSYSYTTVSGRASNPVNWVNFWDAARFANWLHNGQPTGVQDSSTTEDGAYTLTPQGIAANTVTRNSGWRWAVPSDAEWYKAAYYQPAALGGDADDYWRYPTASNTISLAQANFFGAGINNTTPVGSYAANFYNTFDMAGNVWEWNEAILFGSFRGLRGGSFIDSGSAAGSTGFFINFNPAGEDNVMGFRVVQVPPPCAGDANGDFTTDAADLSVLLGQFGQSVTPGTGADFNGDGVVNAADLSILLANFGSSC